MSVDINLEDMKLQLASQDLEIQINGLQQAKGAVDKIVELAIRGFVVSSNKTIYADRLSMLGSVLIPQLKELYSSTQPGDLKTNTAILLLHFGSQAGLPDVIDALKIDNSNQFLAAAKLAKAGIAEAAGPILDLLRSYISVGQVNDQAAPKLTALISALHALRVEIPNDIKKHLKTPSVSKFIPELD